MGPFCQQIELLWSVCCLDPIQLQPMHMALASGVPEQQLAKATQGMIPSQYHGVMGAVANAMDREAKGRVCLCVQLWITL